MPNRRAHHAVLPTKTSLQCIQFAGVSFSFLSAGSHVSSTSFVNLLVLTIFVAVTLLMVSRSLIARCHLALISLSWRGFSITSFFPSVFSVFGLGGCTFVEQVVQDVLFVHVLSDSLHIVVLLPPFLCLTCFHLTKCIISGYG